MIKSKPIKKAKPTVNPWHILGYGMEHIKIDSAIAKKLEDLTGTPASQWLEHQKSWEIRESETK